MSADEEFRRFVAARSGALLRTAYLLTGDHASAEDLLQVALTKTYLSWGRIRDRAAREAYVRRVLLTTSTSWWRRRWHREQPSASLPDTAAAIDDSGGIEERDRIWRLVRQLPPGQRAVLVLRYYEDLSEVETAQVLDVTVGTVKGQASRALRLLRTEIEEVRVP